MTVGDLYRALDKICPFSFQDKWDNSGLLVGEMNMPLERVLVTLDITAEAAEEAARLGCSAVVSHHPVIFHPLTRLDNKNPAVILAKHDIAAVCAHTNLDMAKGGINDIIADMLTHYGFEKTAGLLEGVHRIDGESIGYGRIVVSEKAYTAPELADLLREIFGCTVVRYCDGGREIRRLAICSGSGGGMSEAAVKMGADGFLTGDVKHDVFISARNVGLSLFDCGHFHTENICVNYLANKLREALPTIEFIISENSDPCFYSIK